MKVKMIALALLFMGMQVFAITRNISSMKPADIVKLDYAHLSPDEQNSLWFTAMFTGLQSTRGAARQIIKKNYPNVDWQKIEQIALSAKQSNKIDESIAQAQATVGITRISAVPTVPNKNPTVAGILLAEDQPTLIQALSTDQSIRPAITQIDEKKSAEQFIAPAYFTQKQIAHINAQAKALHALDKQIKQFLPKAPLEDYNVLRESVGQEPSFDEVMNLLRNRRESLEVLLQVLKHDEAKLNETILELQKLFPQLKNLDPNYYMFIGSSAKMSSYDEFKDAIMHVRNINGVKDARAIAQEIKDRLITDLTQLKKLKTKADIISADLPQEKATLLLRLAEELDAKMLKAKDYEPAYTDYKQGSFKQRADELVQQEDDETDIVHRIEELIAEFKEKLQFLAQLEQKRNEYGARVAIIEKRVAALADKAPQPVPYFDELLKGQGLHEATKILNEYQKKLDTVK